MVIPSREAFTFFSRCVVDLGAHAAGVATCADGGAFGTGGMGAAAGEMGPGPLERAADALDTHFDQRAHHPSGEGRYGHGPSVGVDSVRSGPCAVRTSGYLAGNDVHPHRAKEARHARPETDNTAAGAGSAPCERPLFIRAGLPPVELFTGADADLYKSPSTADTEHARAAAAAATAARVESQEAMVSPVGPTRLLAEEPSALRPSPRERASNAVQTSPLLSRGVPLGTQTPPQAQMASEGVQATAETLAASTATAEAPVMLAVATATAELPAEAGSPSEVGAGVAGPPAVATPGKGVDEALADAVRSLSEKANAALEASVAPALSPAPASARTKPAALPFPAPASAPAPAPTSTRREPKPLAGQDLPGAQPSVDCRFPLFAAAAGQGGSDIVGTDGRVACFVGGGGGSSKTGVPNAVLCVSAKVTLAPEETTGVAALSHALDVGSKPVFALAHHAPSVRAPCPTALAQGPLPSLRHGRLFGPPPRGRWPCPASCFAPPHHVTALAPSLRRASCSLAPATSCAC